MAARLDVLVCGYANDRVASTVTLIREGACVVVVDPGMVADRCQILEPMRALGVTAGEVSDVVISHHHPDHTINVALFEHARVHDFWAIYEGDQWTDREADGFRLSESISLMATPGHTPQDISTLVETDDGLVACTHLWWSADGPVADPLAADQPLLDRSRQRLLALSPVLVVPGHGAPFAPPRDDEGGPRSRSGSSPQEL